LIRRDIDLYSTLEFSYCFLDEAQHIKNPNTINAKSVKQIKARGYFALTGTPIENSLTELWSIFDFIMPGYLLSHHKFVKNFESPIIKDSDNKALKELTMHIKPFILRRMKSEVLKELPDKIENKMTAEMTEAQKKLYLAYLLQAKGELAKEISENGFEKSQMKILAALTRLRQICCHPSLFVENYEGESGKLALLEEILEDAIDSKHRILIFSQFTSMLNIIKKVLEDRNISYFYLDGSTKAMERNKMVKQFNEGQRSIFLISLKAGGTGLNLTGADMVIHFDPWWNPSVEDQATDRAYRIGQENVVHVIKLITHGTIEEKIFALQQRKKSMIESIIQPGETLLTKMSQDEIMNLFDMQ
jgi:SNF2 family DNA or RNA helicase